MQSYAQSGLLGKRISLQIVQQPVDKALQTIAMVSGVHFSYNTDLINTQRNVSLNIKNKRLDYVLAEILGSSYYFKSTGTYVIILRETEDTPDEAVVKLIEIRGKATELRSQEPVSQATLYDMAGMQSCLTDSSGTFVIRIKPKTTMVALRCRKEHYSDTVFLLKPEKDIYLEIRMKKTEELFQSIQARQAGDVMVQDTFPVRLVKRFIPDEFLVNSTNVIILERRPAQLSLVPTIGTNLKMSGSVVNNFSINLIGGYSRGVAGFEAGGLFNLTREYVKGVQVAIGANIGADTVKGLQMAGAFNLSRRYLNGVQIAGIGNIARGYCKGIQISGFLNYAPSPAFQFGVINIADTNNGMPLGIFNFIRGGYYATVVSTDESQFYSFLIHMGTNHLYTIAGISGRPAGDSLSWGINYGYGSRLFHKHRLSLDVEMLSTVLNINKRFDETTTTKVSLSTQLSVRMFRGMRLSAGPSMNLFIAKAHNTIVSDYIASVSPSNTWSYTSVNTRFDAWPGWNAALKFSF
jgi:hypothetical protein